MLFIVGLRIVIQDGLDKNKGFIVGAAFLVGLSLQYELIYPKRPETGKGETCGSLHTGKEAGQCSSSSLHRETGTSRTDSPRYPTTMPKRPSNRKYPSGSCGTSPLPYATSNITTRISSPCASRPRRRHILPIDHPPRLSQGENLLRANAPGGCFRGTPGAAMRIPPAVPAERNASSRAGSRSLPSPCRAGPGSAGRNRGGWGPPR